MSLIKDVFTSAAERDIYTGTTFRIKLITIAETASSEIKCASISAFSLTSFVAGDAIEITVVTSAGLTTERFALRRD